MIATVIRYTDLTEEKLNKRTPECEEEFKSLSKQICSEIVFDSVKVSNGAIHHDYYRHIYKL